MEWRSRDDASAQLREWAGDDVFRPEELTLVDLLAEAIDRHDYQAAVSSCRALVIRYCDRSEQLEMLIGAILATYLLLLLLGQAGDALVEDDILLLSRASLRPLRSVSSAGVNRHEFVGFAILLGGLAKDCGVLADGSADVVIGILEQGLRLCDKKIERAEAAELHFYLGTLHAAKRNTDPAVRHFTASRDIWLTHCQYGKAAEAESDAGLCFLRQSCTDSIERLRAELREVQHEIQARMGETGDAIETNDSTSELSDPPPRVEHKTLHCDAAIERLMNALRIAEHGQAASLYGGLYHHLGLAKSRRGLMDESIQWFRRALDWRKDHDTVDSVIFSKQQLARAIVERYAKAKSKMEADLNAALQQLDEALSLLEISPDEHDWARLQFLKGEVHLHRAQGGASADTEAAIACFENARLRFGLLGETREEDRAQRRLARAQAKLTGQS